MAITVFKGLGNELQVASSFRRPAVLLDNCALQRISESEDLGDKMVITLFDVAGTVCLSGMNPAEMSKGDFDKHAIAADQFLSRIFTHLFFIDVSKALQNSATLGDPKSTPPADQETAEDVVNRYWSGGQANSGATDSQRGLFRHIWGQRERVVPELEGTAMSIVGQLLEHRSNAAVVDKLTTAKYTADSHRLFAVFSELLRDLMIDPASNIPPNHTIDVVHATLGMVFCDYVVVDRGWAHRCRIARQRLGAFADTLARPYPANDEGISQMLGDMASQGRAVVDRTDVTVAPSAPKGDGGN